MSEEIYKIVNSISYKNYELLKTELFWTSVVSNEINKRAFCDSALGDGITLCILGAYIFLAFSKVRNNTKEFVIIRENYSRILDNYSKLLEKFDLDNPVQISTMFSNMVEDGYLSVDKTFKFDRLNVYDYSGLGGTNIINGHGVCRHYSAFLTDILHNKDIDAVNLGVCFPDYGFHIELFDEKKETNS